jgi:transposase-like protein
MEKYSFEFKLKLARAYLKEKEALDFSGKSME